MESVSDVPSQDDERSPRLSFKGAHSITPLFKGVPASIAPRSPDSLWRTKTAWFPRALRLLGEGLQRCLCRSCSELLKQNNRIWKTFGMSAGIRTEKFTLMLFFFPEWAPKKEHTTGFCSHKLFEHPQWAGTSLQNSRDIPDSSLRKPRKTSSRGRAQTFRPPSLRVEDPHPTGRSPDPKS